MTMTHDIIALSAPYTATWDTTPSHVQRLTDDSDWDWDRYYDDYYAPSHVYVNGLEVIDYDFDLLVLLDEPDYYSAMMHTLMGMDVDITEDPRPMYEGLHRARVANWGCCDAKGGARCKGFRRKLNSKDKRRK